MTSSPPRRLLIIRNPVAAGGRRARFLRDTLRALHRLGVSVAVAETEGPGHAVRLAAEVDAGRFDVVAAAGGDGTLNEVANGLARAGLANPPPLGLVPIGTANVLARELHLPIDPQKVADALARGPAQPLHLARVSARDGSVDRLFMLMAGVGFDARVVAAVTPARKHRLGMSAFYLTAVRLGLRDPFPRYRIAHAGGVENVSSVIFANGRLYAGNFVNVRQAAIDRPELYARLFPRGGRLATLRAGLALLAHLFSCCSGSYVVEASEFDVDGPRGEPMHGDGEIIARLPVRITADAARLSVIAPPPKRR
jgi:YegS/Rv2252/BmrU family lipid kinase